MRAVSTVLDASLCLLLVTASALTLVGVPDHEGSPDSADELAETLATSTARVGYQTAHSSRTAHDTLAGLLAGAAVADDRRSGNFEQAVTARVARVLRRFESDVQVVARWTSDRSARTVVGPDPPPSADVHAAAFSVPSGSESVRITVRTWSA